MNTIEELNETLKTVSENNLKYGEIHTAYFDSVAKRLGEGYTELTEDSKSFLETLYRANSFSDAFKTQIAFEDATKAKLADLHNSELEAAKMLQDDLTKLFAFETPVSSVNKTSNRQKKAAAKV